MIVGKCFDGIRTGFRFEAICLQLHHEYASLDFNSVIIHHPMINPCFLSCLLVRTAIGCTLEEAGICYTVSSGTDTWSAAEEACGHSGGHLMSVTSKDRQATLETLASAAGLTEVWIGGRASTHDPPLWHWIAGRWRRMVCDRTRVGTLSVRVDI